MNMEKFTNKSREALMEAQNCAVKLNNNELRALHLLYALLNQKEGLTSSIVAKLGINSSLLSEQLRSELEKLPKVSGNQGQIYTSGEFSGLLTHAFEKAEEMGDEYVSCEHLLMGILNGSNSSAESSSTMRASPAKECCRHFKHSGEASASPPLIPKEPLKR